MDKTHSLYLIPADITINELADRFFSNHPSNMQSSSILWSSAPKTSEKIQFKKFKWVMISNELLPNSTGKIDAEQTKMVTALGERSGLNYKVPSFKNALAATFFNIAAEGKGLWLLAEGQGELEFGQVTRTRKIFSYYVAAAMVDGPRECIGGWETHNLTVESHRPDDGPPTPHVNHCHSRVEADRLGVAAIWTNFKSVPPPDSYLSCGLSICVVM
jgi:hypothetical protein